MTDRFGSTGARVIFGCLLTACTPGDGGDGSSSGGSTMTTTDAASTGDASTGDASTGTPTTSGDPTTGEPTTGVDPACACIDPEEFGHESYVCEPGPCALVELDCNPESDDKDVACGGFGTATLTVEPLDCAIDQLIAGTPGMIRYIAREGFGGEGAFVVVGPGPALMRRNSYLDNGANEGPAGFVTLKDTAYFMGCKAEPDPQLRFLCFKEWSDEEPAPTCDEASGPEI
jgi:hypothetical protein